MPGRALALVALLACAESAPEEFQLPEHETVYQCARGAQVIGEWCYPGTAETLGKLVRAHCEESTDERFCGFGPLGLCFPVCLFCCGPECGPGCNAYQGCYCEEGA